MSGSDKNPEKPISKDGPETVPFSSAEETWFWFIAAMSARNDGAQFTKGEGLYPRPCEPVDILKILDRLYRHRRLTMKHFLVMRTYGRLYMPPDKRRIKEFEAWHIWKDAMERLEPALIGKGIVKKPPVFFEFNPQSETLPYDGVLAE